MMTIALGAVVQGSLRSPLASVASPAQAATAVSSTNPGKASDESGSTAKAADSVSLSAEAQRQVAELAAIDRKVRAHEQAHMAVGRDLVRSGASYEYQQGPDGRRYAVAGEVSIDTSPARSAEATIPKAAHIRATALAPADPSAQDQSVAAAAARMEAQARQEMAASRAEAAAAYAAVQGEKAGDEAAAGVDVFA